MKNKKHGELIKFFKGDKKHTQESFFNSHNVYSVDSCDKSLCFTKVGQGQATETNDILITLNPFTSVTGQLLICKKE